MTRAALPVLVGLCLAGCGSDDGGGSAQVTPTSSPSATPTATPVPTPADPLVVMTDRGAVRGRLLEGVRNFLGIPYAAPPVGDLRWRPPEPHAGWSGVRDAGPAGNPCPQILPSVNAPVGDEDCLFLNVHTPDPPPVEPLPVMVWIHGGGFTVGDGLQLVGGTHGRLLAERHGVVVVSMNYRLGQLGFLAHPALSAEDPSAATSGNYGMLDQIAALEWVQRNIAAFGGDPGNVTIFGESAGGWSVCFHLASARSAGLFHRAIVQSGPCASPLAERAAAERQGERFAELLGCRDAADELACMRAALAGDVRDTLAADPTFALGQGELGSWFPIVDGIVLERQIADALGDGAFPRVPVLIGSNGDEGTLFIAFTEEARGAPIAAEEVPELIGLFVADEEQLAAVTAEYPVDDFPRPSAALSAAFGDGFLACPTIATAELLAATVPTYLYQFEYPDSAFSLPLDFELGAFHSAEIQFVFGFPGMRGFTEEETRLAERVMGYWARFAARGDPNGDGATAWPEHGSEGGYLEIDRTIEARAGSPRAAACEFWSTLNLPPPLESPPG